MIQQFSYSGTQTIKYSSPISWYDSDKKERIKGEKEITIELKKSGSANNIPFKSVLKDREGDQKHIFYLEGKSACSHINSTKSSKKTTFVYPVGYIKYTDKESKKTAIVEETEIYNNFTCDDNTYIQTNLWFKQ